MQVNIDDIDISMMENPVPNEKKMLKAFNYYDKFHQFRCEIILINENQLVGGYTSYLVARLYGVTEIDCYVYTDVNDYKCHHKKENLIEVESFRSKVNKYTMFQNKFTRHTLSAKRRTSIRKRLYEKNNKCVCCGKVLQIIDDKSVEDYLTIDHIIPVSLGGQNEIDNLQSMCKQCNEKKSCYVVKDDYITYISNRGLLNEPDLMKLVDLIF